jgi:hypothetical protein
MSERRSKLKKTQFVGLKIPFKSDFIFVSNYSPHNTARDARTIDRILYQIPLAMLVTRSMLLNKWMRICLVDLIASGLDPTQQTLHRALHFAFLASTRSNVW